MNDHLRLSIYAVFLKFYVSIPIEWDPEILDKLLDFVCDHFAPDEIYMGSWLDPAAIDISQVKVSD